MVFEKTFVITSQLNFQIQRIPLKKITTGDYRLISIENSAYFKLSYNLEEDPFLLPKLYAALTHLTGPSDAWYDHYKGSYNFSFELKVQKDYQSSEYFYRLYHYRSYIEFSLFQIIPESDPRDPDILPQSDDALFSNLDICSFSNYFCNYSLGYMEGSKHIPRPFLKYSESDCLVFGYLDNEYFLRSYEDRDEYEENKSLFKSKCGTEQSDIKAYEQYWNTVYEENGRSLERTLIAQRSLNEGIDPMLVSKITGLSGIELQKIAKSAS